MTKNGLDIQTISTKRTDIQTDRVLLLGQVTEKQVKSDPSHFLKFLFNSRTNGTFGIARYTSPRFAKSKELFFLQPAPTIIRYSDKEAQNQKFTELRDWLGPMLMNGQGKLEDENETEFTMAAEP